MEFPRFVYKDGGPVARAGGFYTYTVVDSEFEYHDKLSNGWSGTLLEAINPKDTKQEDNAPPTRSELEMKADELGIQYDGRTGDKTLLAKINKALGA